MRTSEAATRWSLQAVELPGRGGPRLAIEELAIDDRCLAVLGSSGAGKTSLLDMLVGFCPHRGLTSRPESVAWAPADGGLWPEATVRQHLELVGAAPDRIAALLAEYELAALAEARPATLSAGEAARLAVARALAHPAPVLVLDEALEHCDPPRRRRCWQRLVDRVAAEGRQLVYATHDPERVLGTAERVLVLADGRPRFHGAVDELYRRPPDSELAESLGPCTWLPPAQATGWLAAGHQPTHPCIRPEELLISIDTRASENGGGGDATAAPVGITLSAHRYCGGVARSQLRRDDGAELLCWHRPPAALPIGSRVRLQLLSLCALAACLLSACAGGDGPELVVASFQTVSLPSAGSRLPAPRALAACADGGFVAIDTVGDLHRYAADGTHQRRWAMPEVAVGRPEGIVELADGRLLVTDTHYHRLVVFSATGEELQRVGQRGTALGEFIYPIACCVDDAGRIYVAEYGGNDRVQVFDPELRPLSAFGSFGTGPQAMQRPGGVVWADGLVYVGDAFNNRVHVFTDTGEWQELLSPETEWRFPYDCQLGPAGDLWLVEYDAGRLTRLARDGRLRGRYGSPGHGPGQFATPWGLCTLADGRIVVADTGNHRLVVLELP